MKDDYVHLHTHSDMSQLDGCGKISEFAEVAKERGNPALAFTEHGTMRGYFSHHESCKKVGIAPIYGIEFYVSQDMNRKGLLDDEKLDITKDLKKSEYKAAIAKYESEHGIRDRWHITCWAKNETGLKNLFRLSSMAFTDGFYYKPRIDLKTLCEYGEGLAVATGCLSSPINDMVGMGRKRKALEYAEILRERFGEDLWLEIQPHAIDDQRKANQFALDLKKRWGKHAKLLACQDAHYVNRSDAEHHEVLLCIGTGSNMSDPDRFKFDGDEFHMRTRKQMYSAFRRHHDFIPSQHVKEALDSTLVLASQINFDLDIDWHRCLMPPVELPKKYGSNDFLYMKDLAVAGWKWREIIDRAKLVAKREGISHVEAIQRYKDRLKMELGAIKRQKYVAYFLIVHDLYGWVRKRDIACGPGRGSAAGSLVSYLLGITSVDPIAHGLIFERFISPSRIDMPDVDMDFEDVRRQEIIQYLRERYGEDKVCQIATIGKLSGKQCLQDVSRVLGVPYQEVKEVTGSIIERSSGDERASQTIADSFKEFEVCRAFNKKYPQVLHHATHLEGMAKSLGIHAAGVVTSPVPLTDIIPLETRNYKGKRVIVSAVDMYGVAANGLLKLDVLGLRTLTVLSDCKKAIKERHDVDIDLEGLDLNDPETLQGFTDHDYGGIFQYDTPGADKICSGVEFVHFEDIAAMTALNRPGTARSGLASDYVARKKNPKLVEKTAFHPAVSEITKDTLGIIVYQEHVLKIFTIIAGFPPATADSLRKTIAKKIGDETLGKERANFIAGAVENTPGMTEKVAGKIMDAITFFGSYGFNKSHATCYAMIAYWGMWLKRRYPIEFYWALMKNEPDRKQIQQYAKDAKKHDIKMLPPHVSSSSKDFSIDAEAHAIRGSLVDIKGCGEKAAQCLMDTQPYTDIYDFVDRIDRRRVNRGVVKALAQAGALKGIIPNPKWFLENLELVWKELIKKKRNQTRIDELFAEAEAAPEFTEEEAVLLATQVNPLAFGKHPIDAYKKFMKRSVKRVVADMSSETFFRDHADKAALIAGVIVEVKFNQIGDFHTGVLPTEEERDRMFWGARYANVNVEDRGGVQNRIKFDLDIFESHRALIDKGIGTPVIVHATANEKYENLKAHWAVDLEQYRVNVKSEAPLSVWESYLGGNHPAITYPWRKERLKRVFCLNSVWVKSAHGAPFAGLVTNVRIKFDKKGKIMAFFGLLGANGLFIDVIAFASVWHEMRTVVKPGAFLLIPILKRPDRFRGLSYFYDGGKIKVLKKSAAIVVDE